MFVKGRDGLDLHEKEVTGLTHQNQFTTTNRRKKNSDGGKLKHNKMPNSNASKASSVAR
jgi:hypothetical protein